ncbi:apyrase [Bombus vosnesenskii]|uniref:apyrase n=1 Tax=Bombus vosnesenskii TaxID=207650 RepID=A0A6J3LMD9_9HYME|nr:apyrase [Bombus vancouverensis nearcticus]XP_033187146.1 apyrase [Bombus vancouverensis nearcticus]XP_033187147.1 apyrase [Bombus vancouverensis nearcticus]XP_033187148.1 apyrase [Bombus vancouverensis nearcticus]XP_033366648.1 apyrase [Bombus vosnesenskii]XP_033366649.1 apyrase [Bombus vosnesenskii]XP_033366650.1 apyrase [Bombus vosnesenskii]XP_050489271.1 apyrase isoform X1 [Bombus huntii]XP_050489272.1 apyrase isoform X1 [Bombus huntii]
MLPFLLLPFLLQICYGFTGRGLYYPGRSDLFELSVIHLNDFHARFEQTGPRSEACHEGEEKDCVGGISRVSTAVNRLMNERPNPIFLNAGDHYQGTLWYNVHRWNATATFMNMLPHDVMTIGNHEFDDDIEGVVPFLKMVKAPVVVTNIDASEEPTMQGLYKNSTIIERNGTKIGVIGVIISTTDTISITGKLKFLDEVESVNDEARRLKSRGIDIIIVLSHCGLDVDRIMAAKCPLIDLIVGGHSHTFLYSGPAPFIDEPEDEYPVVVVQEETNRTVLIVQAAAFTKYLGNLTVWFDADGEVVDWDGNPILLDYSIEEDPEMLKALAPWKVRVDEKAGTKIARTRVFLDNKCRRNECNLGNLITDAMVDAYVERAENKTVWTYAAVGVYNPGGIRAPIDSIGQDITFADLIMAQPFENTWDILELKGSCILQILEMEEDILIWSGLKVVYKIKGNSRKVEDVKIRCRACEVPRYEELVLDQWYRIVLPTFLVQGGDGFVPFETCGRNHEVGYLDWVVLSKYMKKISPILTGRDRRVIFLDGNSS